jgi:hypothetical protein
MQIVVPYRFNKTHHSTLFFSTCILPIDFKIVFPCFIITNLVLINFRPLFPWFKRVTFRIVLPLIFLFHTTSDFEVTSLPMIIITIIKAETLTVVRRRHSNNGAHYISENWCRTSVMKSFRA